MRATNNDHRPSTIDSLPSLPSHQDLVARHANKRGREHRASIGRDRQPIDDATGVRQARVAVGLRGLPAGRARTRVCTQTSSLARALDGPTDLVLRKLPPLMYVPVRVCLYT